MSSHISSRGAHLCMPGMPLQTWLMLASGAVQLLLVHESPAHRTHTRQRKASGG